MVNKGLFLAVLALALPMAAFASSGGVVVTNFDGTFGTFAGGCSFAIMGNGTNGVPNGVFFSRTFTGPVNWTIIPLANRTREYTLSGAVEGTLGNGYPTVGAYTQLGINTGTGYFSGSTPICGGVTNIVVPEPGTLSLFGTGLIGLAGVVRRKFSLA